MIKYNISSVVIGAVYFFGVIFFYNIIGHYFGSIFASTQNDSIGLGYIALVNFITSFIGGVVPSILVLIVIHFLLNPKTSFYLTGIFFSYILLSVYYSANLPEHFGDYYYLDYLAKGFGGLLILWLMSLAYLKKKPNNAFKRDAEKAPRPLT